MIPIKNFREKNYFLAKQASQMKKDAEIVKNFQMPVVALLAGKKKKKSKK